MRFWHQRLSISLAIGANRTRSWPEQAKQTHCVSSDEFCDESSQVLHRPLILEFQDAPPSCPFREWLWRKREGRGHGLAIARKFVEMLGGQIDVESRVGAMFYFLRSPADHSATDNQTISEMDPGPTY